MTKLSDPLKPCPFCGGTEVHLRDITETIDGELIKSHYVNCYDCEAMSEHCNDDDAINAYGFSRYEHSPGKLMAICSWNLRKEPISDKNIYNMYNWNIESFKLIKDGQTLYRLLGKSDRYEGGYNCRTSELLKIDYVNMVAETRNTIYKLKEGEFVDARCR